MRRIVSKYFLFVALISDLSIYALQNENASHELYQNINKQKNNEMNCKKPPRGPQGETGVTGPTGPIGATGIMGVTGVVGPIGNRGERGMMGTAGLTGATGATGSTGIQGVIGFQGAVGFAGAAGSTGIVGTTGATGATGTTGPISPPLSVAFASFYQPTQSYNSEVTNQQLAFDFSDYTPSGIIQSTPSDFEILIPGIYLIKWTLTASATAGTGLTISLAVNGVLVNPTPNVDLNISSGALTPATGTKSIQLNTGDIVSLVTNATLPSIYTISALTLNFTNISL
jgi:Collagen triple helix repeat (20 copies)